MMCVLQRIDADHIVTWGQLAIRAMTYVTMEPSLAYRHGMIQRIPAGRYVIESQPDSLIVKDVLGGDVNLVSGPYLKPNNRDIHVGLARGKARYVEDSGAAFLDIHKTITDALAAGDECFLSVVDGNALD